MRSFSFYSTLYVKRLDTGAGSAPQLFRSGGLDGLYGDPTDPLLFCTSAPEASLSDDSGAVRPVYHGLRLEGEEGHLYLPTKAATGLSLIVIGAANNGQSGVDLVLREKPDLVLMDIRMPIMDGLEATRRIAPACAVCIVMLTAFADEEVREQAREAGSRGFLLKPVTGPTLIAALEQFYRAFQEDPARL